MTPRAAGREHLTRDGAVDVKTLAAGKAVQGIDKLPSRPRVRPRVAALPPHNRNQ
jgi:hypothetical protein